MELLSPAGNLEKLEYAYLYGADAVYIGVKDFSLRTKADNFHGDEFEKLKLLKGNKKLYCALNIYFHNKDLKRLEGEIDYIARYPFDAFIVSDLGLLPFLKRRLPKAKLHLSTQANCVNAEAALVYRDLGFSRIILGRETTLEEIAEIKARVGGSRDGGLEVEVFVHGAMCLAYSGRCFLSAWMAGRSGNQGTCAHACRWTYRVLEEAERPGEYYPIFENEDYTTILSSRDLCLIDHLKELWDAGVDSIKIEGRMKSLYYTAVVTRAYRKHLDALGGTEVPDLAVYREDLDRVSHREYCTGFFFGREEVSKPTEAAYREHHVYLGTFGEEIRPGVFRLVVKNTILAGDKLEFIGPDRPFLPGSDFEILGDDETPVPRIDHGKTAYLRTGLPVKPGYILRKSAGTEPYVEA